MNDHYRELLREYIRAVNLTGQYTNVQKNALEKKLWEAVRAYPGEPYARPSESTAALH